MAKKRRVIDYSDDDDFDPNILQDGETLRVPMRFADSAQRALGTHIAANGGLLHRPGYLTRDSAATQRVNDAYASYETSLRGAYRDADPGWPSGAGAGFAGTYEGRTGDACTVRNAEYPNDFGSPGHLENRGGRMICVPDNPRSNSSPPLSEASADARRLGDAKQQAMDDYLNDLQNAWKTAT
jgi:hypothetical protein